MKILVVGSGGREHAIVEAISRNSHVQKIYCAPGNGGIRERAELVPIPSDDVRSLAEFAAANRIDLTFVGPEVPLAKGIVDEFRRMGLKIIGPTRDQARLESSKSFAKKFFRENDIPTADFWECTSIEEARAVLERNTKFPLVIKADGLAAGKGVIIAEDRKAADKAVDDLMRTRTLGAAGDKVVIEEFLVGEEASFHVFADSHDFQPMVPAQDHKRRFDNDTGPNTGGMGAYSVDAILSASQHAAVINRIVRPTLSAAQSYSGILYAGLMLTTNGPKLIEYNARFGDPETQVILPRLKTDLVDVLVDLAEHHLAKRALEWSPEVTASVVLVSEGYPSRSDTGKEIHGLTEANRMDGIRVYHAGTQWVDGRLLTAGGRVLNVTGTGSTLQEALDRVYAASEVIQFEGKAFRTDIGRKGLAKTR